MKNRDKTEKYFLYARKSSESDERQVQSIDDQLDIMRKKASFMWIKIVDEFTESMSAKAPWRFRFNEMIERLRAWEARWIISWKLDRLTRNPIDTGTIQYMLQTWKLDIIATNDREYYPEDSWLIFSVETWMANQYILDLIKNVRRWLDSKYNKWIRPTKAPLGYINDRDNGWIAVEDPDRYHIIRKIWDFMLTWTYLPPQILDMANDDWWLRTRKRKNWWWNPLSRSSIYRIFNSLFYAGYYYHNWELKKGIHQPMITLEEYDRVQYLLWKKWNHRPQNYEFAFTGMVKCWECWSMVTAEIKNKYIKTTWKTVQYIYYRCTKRKKGTTCNQKTIRVEKLEEQISELLSKIEMMPEFKEWCIDILKENYSDEIEKKLKIFENINKNINSEEKKLKNLTDLLLDEFISKDEFIGKKEALKVSLERLKEQRNWLDTKAEKVQELVEKVFDFACRAKESFSKGTLLEKKEILSTLGQNFELKDWILTLEVYPWFKTLENELNNRWWWLNRLEPTKNSTNFGKVNAISMDCIKWSEMWDSNSQPHGPKPCALANCANFRKNLSCILYKQMQLFKLF